MSQPPLFVVQLSSPAFNSCNYSPRYLLSSRVPPVQQVLSAGPPAAVGRASPSVPAVFYWAVAVFYGVTVFYGGPGKCPQCRPQRQLLTDHPETGADQPADLPPRFLSPSHCPAAGRCRMDGQAARVDGRLENGRDNMDLLTKCVWTSAGAHTGFSQGGRNFSYIVGSMERKINLT